MYGLYTILTSYYHWIETIKGDAVYRDSASPFNPWKIVSGLFEIVLVMEIGITGVFWIMIAPLEIIS